MFDHNWLTWPTLMWLVTCCLHSGINGQSQHAIGAHRVFEKTSFSCAGRPAGYYADIETGCQVYHMCDGLGRQFSYSCPNTTLFQQRMLICDHWYMVNCSKAESHYAANLLIGQRDKPFVDDKENSLRTPRPDLLDRPYAPDYSGESFRNEYKQYPALQNQIQDSNAPKTSDKSAQGATGQQRWKIPQPSRTILPPAYEPQVEEEEATTPLNARIVSTTKAPTRTLSTANTRTTASYSTPASRKQSNADYNNAALLQRQGESLPSEQDDLGTSHSTRYNTSSDFNSAEDPLSKTKGKYSSRKSFNVLPSSYTNTATTSSPTLATTTAVPVKVPSKIYEPPFLYPIYNQDDAPSTEKPLIVSSAQPFSSPSTTRTSSTTRLPPSQPVTRAGKPFTAPSSSATPTASSAGRNQNNLLQSNYEQSQRFDSQKLFKDARTPTPAQGFKAPTPRPPVNSAKTKTPQPAVTLQTVEASAFDYKVPTTSRLSLPTPVITAPSSASSKSAAASDLPANELLPPFKEFTQHDVATTQGPPIYYEWKVPSNGLEPPKLDAPIGVDGREYPDAISEFSAPLDKDQQKGAASVKKPIASSNPFLPTKPSASESSTPRQPTSRSVKDTAQPNALSRPAAPKTTTTTRRSQTSSTTAATPAAPADIMQLRKELSVPEYSFPLENIGRTGYLASDSFNSFQLKIPERRSDANEHLHWFGENSECPECHPSYVVPGTCEPCLRR